MSHQELLFTRDKLPEFSAMRRAAQQQAGSSCESRQPRGGDRCGETESPAASTPCTGTPPWIRALQHFVDLESTIHLKIERLHAEHREFFLPRFLSDEAEVMQQREIDQHAQDIQRLLRELDRMIGSGMRPHDSTNEDEQRAAENAKRHLSSRLSELIREYKEGQELYAAQLKRREEKRRRFNQIGSHESHARLEKEEKIAQYMELGYTSTDIQELLVEEAKQSEINIEIGEVVESITELHEMFKDLNTMVLEQGTVLDRIDFNVQQTQTNTQRGVEQLKKAQAKQDTCHVM